MPHLTIEENSRTIVPGQTGSGKTRFCAELLQGVKRLIVIDVKYNLGARMNLEPESRRAWKRFIEGKDIRLQVKGYDFAKTKLSLLNYYEDVFRKIWIAGDCVLYIDELALVTDGAQQLRPNLKKLYVAGRESIEENGVIARGNIGIVAASQRPSGIPTFCISEAQNCAAFYLGNPDDRDKIADYFGQAIREPVPDEHGFYWRSSEMRDPVYYPGLPNIEADHA